ncbi:hypothetical protein J6836_00810 [Providencia sp. R33]|uniref:hypothetical protein n=1 Tax=Providencia sp. R33 TaxID=2828763 RepID=UPI001C5BEC29|nr:hypothetical protein [Providencia sp. R33]QXX82968.1 hypothetical protein J6836_00810 [Providencia sp. R33]
MSNVKLEILVDSSSIDVAISKIQELKKEIRELNRLYNTGNILGQTLNSVYKDTHDHNEPQIKA